MEFHKIGRAVTMAAKLKALKSIRLAEYLYGGPLGADEEKQVLNPELASCSWLIHVQ